jgi:uncharacterized protein involved in outer membrane biogenesis
VRIVLTFVAVALVVILSIALVAPLFVDWSAHRAELESRLGGLTGAEVALTGPITVRLLPTPYLEVGQGSISGRGEDAPRLSFASARLELALVKLASGAIRFSEIDLDKPVLTISRTVDGALRLPVFPAAEAETVGFDRLAVQDGKVRIAERARGAARELSGVQLEADAVSLAGPYHVSGQLSGPADTPVEFHLASERSGADGTVIRASIGAGSMWPALQFDGVLVGPDPKGPSLSGSATVVGVGGDGQTAWRAAGRMTADLDRAAIEQAEFRFGSDEKALRADGSATLAYGSPARLVVEAKAKQANLDGLFRLKGEEAVPPARAFRLMADALAPAFGGSGLFTIGAKLSAGDVILGGETLSDVSASLRSQLGAPMHARFDIGLPGRSRLRGEGDFETGAAARFEGLIDFKAEDLALVRKWASQGAPVFADKLAAFSGAVAYRSGSLSGHVSASAAGFSGRDLTITLDRSKLNGALAYASPAGVDPGRLYMDLSSASLDVDVLPNIDASAAIVGNLDLLISLKADALHIAHINDAAIDSGSFALKLTKKGPNVTLDRLSLSELGGAALDAQGVIGRDGASATGRLRADQLRDFASLISRLAPGDWSRTLAERAEALSPTGLSFEAHGSSASAGAPALNSLKANGTIGQTQASLSLEPGAKEGRQLLTVSLDSPDSSALLRQLGFRAASAASGRGHIALQASGGWAEGYDLDATGALAGTDISGRGRLLPGAEGDDARLFGSVRVKSANVSPLMVSLGLAPAGGALGPVDASAELTLRGDRWTASRATATVAGVKASGNLAYQPAPQPEAPAVANPDLVPAEDALAAAEAIASQGAPTPEITGDLSLDRLSSSELFALALGPPQPVKPGAHWSDAKFAAPPLSLPSSALGLNVGTLDMIDGLAAQGLSTNLRVDRGRLDLDDIRMKVAGGAASGHLTLRRDRETATLTGALNLEKLAIDRPGFSGRLGGALDFASTGRSPAALFDGLAGSGTAQFAGATLSGSDPAALDRVVAKAQASDAPQDETNVAYALENELNKAPLPIPDGAMPIALTAGTMKFGPLLITRPHGEATLSGSLDLGKLTLGTRLALTSPATGLKFWSGPPPSATVTVQDALGTRKQQLDVSALSAGLATQAIARASDRIAAFEADIRERAFFNRRLKGERFLDRRAAEIEAWRVEQERLKSLAEREAAEKAAEEAAAAKAAADKAAAERAAAEKAAAEKAAAEKRFTLPDLPPDLPPASIAKPAPNQSSDRGDQVGANAPPTTDAPLPPSRPKPRPAPDPTAGGFY